MQSLNIPYYEQKVRRCGGRLQIYDPLRRRYVALTPEEWVRQNINAHLVQALGVPASRIAVEIAVEINGMNKRCDALVYDQQFAPLMVVEYKAPTVPIAQSVFDQAAAYNYTLQVPFLLVSNGLVHVLGRFDAANKSYLFYEQLLPYNQLLLR